MAMFIFAALTAAAIALAWGTAAVALRHSQQELLTMEEIGPESGLSIAPAHLRMW